MHLKIYSEDEHQIDQASIDPDALSVIFHLKSKGFDAFLVGGGVRDLLLKKKPKDFDVATSARPEEIKHVFGHRCLLIGRRFRLAHIRAGKKIFEVSTFRSGDIESSSLILRDNCWGSGEDDVLRRDFTMNALFYDPTTRSVYDYVGGVDDIDKHTLRTIGEAHLRFKQDPVRMIRLLKFKARFGFAIDPKTEHALIHTKHEIVKSSPARLLEEIFKMLESGASAPFFELMNQYGFLELLFPSLYHFFSSNQETALKYLQEVDKFHQTHEKKLSRSLLFALLAFPILEQEMDTLISHRTNDLPTSEIYQLSTTLMQGLNASSFCHFPKRLLYLAHLACYNQYRLTPVQGEPRYKSRFLHSPDFLDAIWLLYLRTQINRKYKPIYLEWKKVYDAHARHRHSHIQ